MIKGEFYNSVNRTFGFRSTHSTELYGCKGLCIIIGYEQGKLLKCTSCPYYNKVVACRVGK